MQSINVVVDDFTSDSNKDEGIYLIDEAKSQLQKINVAPDVVTQDVQENITKSSVATTSVTKAITNIFYPTIKDPPTRIEKNHPAENIIGDLTEGIKMRDKPKRNYQEMVKYVYYTSSIEPKNVKEALQDEYWVKAMQEELKQFVRNDVWTLVSRPKDTNVWNKMDLQEQIECFK